MYTRAFSASGVVNDNHAIYLLTFYLIIHQNLYAT